MAKAKQASWMDAKRLLIRDTPRVRIALIGCGGTGSHLAGSLAITCKTLEARGKHARLLVCDGDYVEPRNLDRQVFTPQEAEKRLNKAFCTGIRCAEMGVKVEIVDHELTSACLQPLEDELTIIVGAVDTPEGRQVMAGYLDLNREKEAPWFWWLDCGCQFNSGQIILGSRNQQDQLERSFLVHPYCQETPSAALIHPELLQPKKRRSIENDRLSCAERAALNQQSLTVNQVAAAYAATIVNRMLTGSLFYWGLYFDLEIGSNQVLYNLPEAFPTPPKPARRK